jgi:hypothetical protein
MPDNPTGNTRRPNRLVRAIVEVTFIVFLFYANLLMGEFTASAGRGKTLIMALQDVITPANFLIAICSAIIGYFVFESLRRKA